MQAELYLRVGLPVALAIIMLGLGLALRLADFSNIAARPKPAVIGLVCHCLILPILCLGLVILFGLSPAFAVGMMLLSVSPAGTTGALLTHLLRGDVALSLTIAGLTSIISVVTLPLVANASMAFFYGEGGAVALDLTQIVQFFAIAILPAAAGMAIRARYASLAAALERPVKLLATLFLAAIVGVALASNWNLVELWGPSVGSIALIFAIVTLAVSYGIPLLLGVRHEQAIALAMTICVHNAAMVITMALSEFMLDNEEVAIPPAMYGLVAYILAGIVVLALSSRRRVATQD